MRVASLLPSATEIVCALGLRDSLVGVTHECDYPPGVEALPHLTASLLPDGMASRAIDDAVRASLKDDVHTIYALDVQLLHALAPDVVLTQALCDVCAVPTKAVEDAVCTMPRAARVVSLDPLTLDDVIASVEQVADALDVPAMGAALASRLRDDLAAVRAAVYGAPRRRVLAAEWLDPIYCGGHWVPDMIDAAGGSDAFGTHGQPSHVVGWDDVAAADPDVIVLMPCGFDAREVVQRYGELAAAPQCASLRAVCERNVYAVDATSYFSRPGPRLVEGTRILARILHPDRVALPLTTRQAYKLGPGGGFEALT